MKRALKWIGILPWIGAGALALPATGQSAVIDYVFVDGFEAAVDCAFDLGCAVPAPGQACLTGRIGEAASGRPMRAFFQAGLACADGAIGGACNLKLTTYDAVELAANPAAAAPMTADVYIDGCARFRITGQTPPSLGFLAIVADDLDPAAESDLHVPSTLMLAVGANQEIEDLELVAARQDSVARWTASAGSPFGADSFADVGAILFTFRAAQVPVAGVTVVRDGSASPAQDYYFGDTVPSQRQVVDSLLAQTGPNGSALFVNGPLANYSGSGGAPVGCMWPAVLSTSIPGHVVFVAIDC